MPEQESDPPVSRRKKAEDRADGCRAFESDDRDRADAAASNHMRSVLSRSADAWGARADLLERLEAKFTARAEANVDAQRRGMEASDDG